jgi:hypothetical protein
MKSIDELTTDHISFALANKITHEGNELKFSRISSDTKYLSDRIGALAPALMDSSDSNTVLADAIQVINTLRNNAARDNHRINLLADQVELLTHTLQKYFADKTVGELPQFHSLVNTADPVVGTEKLLAYQPNKRQRDGDNYKITLCFYLF